MIRPSSSPLCARCGYPRSEHHYNGACYGLCGEFIEGKAMTLNGYMIRFETWEKFIRASNGSERMKQLVIDRVREEVPNRKGLIDSFEAGLAIGALMNRFEAHPLDLDDLIRTIELTRDLNNVPIVEAHGKPVS